MEHFLVGSAWCIRDVEVEREEDLGEALDPFRVVLPDLWLTHHLQFLVVPAPHPGASALAAALFWVVLGGFGYWLEISFVLS